jgi:hypothetical protein
MGLWHHDQDKFGHIGRVYPRIIRLSVQLLSAVVLAVSEDQSWKAE